MRFVYEQIDSLPKLAWLATVEPLSDVVHVRHGAFVETHGRFFIEGAWDGDFAVGDFGTTNCVFGSGAVLEAGAVVFVSCAATTDYLYWKTAEGRATVSNSLPLLLAALDDRLRPDFEFYHRINRSIVEGIDRYVTTIPTARGSVRRLMYRNLRVPMGSRPVELEKQLAPSFRSYEAYFAYVSGRYGHIAKNARDPARAKPLAIFSTQSRGYDTTAINAMAAPYGVDAAFTVSTGKVAGVFADRETEVGPNDDGTEICQTLGIRCIPIDRRAYEREFGDESLYYATDDVNGDANFHGMCRHIDGAALLLTGTLGEIWYTRISYYLGQESLIDGTMKRGDLGGHGLTEIRLRAGFIQVAVPYLGAQQRSDIFTITESAEMAPWRLGNVYDRPIPRRMGEEAGISRHLFGQTKMASVVEFSRPPLPYGQALRAEYLQFLVEHRILRPWQKLFFPLVHWMNSKICFVSGTRHVWLYYVQRVITKLRGRPFEFDVIWSRLEGRLFCFCANKRADEYGAALAIARATRPSIVVPDAGRPAALARVT